ncbi:neutral/alkaline non-lysosomal ceramidase N-terminal domain-containing protein [Pontibacter silvestris]|uniref:Neutral ceramidase n=1 Tax=Pontibacter silvestris TaxID=2305183 RepID=A0ABW4WSH1_9BACT|nr:neutral/alkaline non-lysosomal ceramidase N-terminal domain-containing protein [Pontibacter silvestris]MCC9137861.1 neutral/alkaline non-lysosomal ceramidase N-terminal domain-containing protein [Pontibacter silvestris]
MKHSTTNKIIKYILLILLLLLLLAALVIRPINETPLSKTSYYNATEAQLQKQPPVITTGDTIRVGWAKVNITPPAPAPLAGYGKRLGMEYEEVHDSVWVRTFAFDNGQTKAFFVSLDMLIVPMRITAALEKEFLTLGLKPEQVYLSAIHSHTSFGGWGKKPGIALLSGEYDEQIVQQTTQRIIESIKQALQRLQPTRIGYGSANAASWVQNRLTESRQHRDTNIRFLKFEQAGGKTAILCSFAAHPTILPSMQPILSRDYPGELVDALEERIEFAAFSAGAVGSHSTTHFYGDTFESTAEVGQRLATLVRQELPHVNTAFKHRLGYARAPLVLPEPQWRITENLRLAPFLFNLIFGKHAAFISSLQIGNTILLGVPADYSGEFMPVLEKQALKQKQQVIVTSFNGGYMGYITPDQYYGLNEYETRGMNFYGPHSGTYLTHVMQRVLQEHRN